MQWFPLAFCIIVFRHAVGTPLDVRSAHRKGLYVHRPTQHRNTKRNIYAPRVIRTHDPSNQAAKTYVLDRAATGAGQNPSHRTHVILGWLVG
jgi:hypothetical protein